MKDLIEHISGWLAIFAWLAGVVLAKGFWITTAAIFFPPFGWYLVVEKLIT
ncbi:MAG: hypothetical protein V4730_11825 [Pseudomonadota bacterium]